MHWSEAEAAVTALRVTKLNVRWNTLILNA